MENYLEVLKKEFEAEDESFIIKAHSELIWDREAFNRLVTLMYRYCEENESKELVERWVAAGFWDIPSRIEDWKSRSNYFNNISDDYYQKAYSLLQDLSWYFFTGLHPLIDKRNLVEDFIKRTK